MIINWFSSVQFDDANGSLDDVDVKKLKLKLKLKTGHLCSAFS